MTSLNLLSIVVFLPLAGAIAAAFFPADEPGQQRAVALVTSLLDLPRRGRGLLRRSACYDGLARNVASAQTLVS